MSVNAYMCVAAKAYVISGKGISPRPAYLGAYEPNAKSFPDFVETVEEEEGRLMAVRTYCAVGRPARVWSGSRCRRPAGAGQDGQVGVAR